ncbi:IS5 family transposase [Sphingobium sp. D43FB]|uniref:IS5 family transposase n=1 Tax=Sphingobium sp. D43FB TaxID=2017595 RepID=UPI000BB52CC8|nr:hypothetical protein SxD43FB_22760 [Sphingobium sp. D43FB]
MLRRIHANANNLVHSGSPSLMSNGITWHYLMPYGGRPHQQRLHRCHLEISADHRKAALTGAIRPCVGSGRKRGQSGQALGRSRGGFTTKIHAKADGCGDLIAFDLTGGEASDCTHFETLLDIGPDISPRAAIADKGYSSKANRAAARARSIAPVIPHKANEKNKPTFFARTLYKARGRIEQGFGRLKRFKRVALRCEKTAENYRSIVSFAAGLCLIKFVHTT